MLVMMAVLILLGCWARQPLDQRLLSAFLRPLREQRGDARAGSSIRILVDRDIDTACAGFLDQFQRGHALAPVEVPITLWWVI